MIDYSKAPELMISMFHPMDLLFYGLAVYEGYKFSFQNLSDDQISELQSESLWGLCFVVLSYVYLLHALA